jgi:hypothetical protein
MIINKFIEAFEKLGWDPSDDIELEIAGTAVSGIDVGEEYNKKWQSPIGTRKYNKDAFIVVKNHTRTPFAPSVNDDPERRPHHCKQDSKQSTGCDSQVEASEQQSDSGEPANEHSGAG